MANSSDIPLIPLLEPDERCRIWRRKSRRIFDPAPRRIPELNLFLGLAGTIQYFINGKMVRINRGTLLVASSLDYHFLVSEDAQADMIVAAIGISLLNHPALQQIQKKLAKLLPLRISELHLIELEVLADRLIDTESVEALDLGLSWWLHRLTELSVASDHASVAEAHPAVAKALEQLRCDPATSIAQVAANAGATATHLGQLFKREVGITMTAYRTQQRLDAVEASRQKKPRGNLLAAALDAGFSDYSSFYRAYVKNNGRAPRRSRSS